ncbi:hypothetical protein ACFL54_07435 [Planctomycetota bacterium]
MTPNKEKTKTPQQGPIRQQEISRIIMLAGIIVVIITAIYTIPQVGKGSKSEPVKTTADAVDFSQMNDYAHAFPPPTPPTPMPYVANPEVLAGIKDSSSTIFFPVEEDARDNLLHKARDRGERIQEEIDSSSPLEFKDLTSRPDEIRGLPVKIYGNLNTIQKVELAAPGTARIKCIWQGRIKDEENRFVFFSVARHPTNIYVNDRVVLKGYFLKMHRDPSDLKVGPLIIANNLELQGPPQFNFDDIVLEKLVRDDDPEMIQRYSAPGLYYLLHKLRTSERKYLSGEIDPALGIQQMVQQPRQVRGKAVSIPGILLLPAERVAISENQSGLRHAYFGYFGNETGIFRFAVIEPPLFRKGTPIVLEGYFLQRLSHKDRENNTVVTPLITGYALKINEPKLPKPNNMWMWIAGFFILTTVGVILFLTYVENRISIRYTSDARKRFRRPDLNLKVSADKLISEREESKRLLEEKRARKTQARNDATNPPEETSGETDQENPPEEPPGDTPQDTDCNPSE